MTVVFYTFERNIQCRMKARIWKGINKYGYREKRESNLF